LPFADSKKPPLESGSVEEMASDGTTHTELPSLRRVYKSRPLRNAIVASGACKEPASTCDRPREERTKTSHIGHWFSVMGGLVKYQRIRPRVRIRRRGTSWQIQQQPHEPRRRLHVPGGGAAYAARCMGLRP